MNTQEQMQKHCRVLELGKVLGMLAEKASCADSRQRAAELMPATTLRAVTREMGMTSGAFSLIKRFGAPVVFSLANHGAALKRAQAGATIGMKELLGIAQILRNAQSLTDWRRRCEEETTLLDELFEELSPKRQLEERISSSILSEEEMADTASPALADIRRKIRNSQQKVRDHLDSMVRSATYQKYLQDPIVTMRDGRYVLPVKAECRAEVKGLVHATSSSGSTLFVEPMGVVDANNEIKVLESKEQAEIERILLELSNEVGENADAILQSYDAIVDLDLYFAKARLADEMNAVAPEINDVGFIDLKKARHPLIDQKKVVPTDIRLGGDFDTLVITGPNTGGKTVALKTLGLFTLMAMCGLMIPANFGSEISVFHQVLADIGDEQSIEQSLSTFSSHMTNIIQILECADDNTLILIDELGAGTDPVEGAALAIAIINRLRLFQAKIAATTHYAELKIFALETKGVENASCEFDVQTLRPTYRLLIGIPGRSNAFAISERLGMSHEIVEEARDYISNEHSRFEDVVTELENTRQQLEQEREEVRKASLQAIRLRQELADEKKHLDAEREKELEKAKAQARQIVDKVKYESEFLLEELAEAKRAKDQAEFSKLAAGVKGSYRASIRKLEELSDPVTRKNIGESYQPPRELRRGDVVLLPGTTKEGTILSDPDRNGYVIVQAGIIKSRIPVSELRLVDQKKRQVTVNSRPTANVRSDVSKSTRSVRSELDLRGMASDEAIIEVDQFIDNAVLMGLKALTIIHGKGTGTLRSAIQTHLKKHKNVKSFRLGVYGEGESGVTVVELK